MLKPSPDFDVIELPESNWCCGSAGIYNITQPEQSAKLLERKLENIERTGSDGGHLEPGLPPAARLWIAETGASHVQHGDTTRELAGGGVSAGEVGGGLIVRPAKDLCVSVSKPSRHVSILNPKGSP